MTNLMTINPEDINENNLIEVVSQYIDSTVEKMGRIDVAEIERQYALVPGIIKDIRKEDDQQRQLQMLAELLGGWAFLARVIGAEKEFDDSVKWIKELGHLSNPDFTIDWHLGRLKMISGSWRFFLHPTKV